MGIDRYIQQQLNPASIPESAALTKQLAQLHTLSMNPVALAQQFRPMGQGQVKQAQQKPNQQFARTTMQQAVEARLLRATESDRQLQESMVDFWFNHFNVFFGKGLTRDRTIALRSPLGRIWLGRPETRRSEPQSVRLRYEVACWQNGSNPRLLKLGDRALHFSIGSVIMLNTDLIALNGDIPAIEVANIVDLERGLIFRGVSLGFVGGQELLFILGNRIFNHFSIYVRAIRFGVDSCKNDSVMSFEIVDDAIAATFTFLNIAVFEPNFEDGVADSRDAIARKFACL